MLQLYMITVPGLEVRSDWIAVHDRLLDDFPAITDVLATTMASTVLIVYDGRGDIDAWLDSISDAILGRRLPARGERWNVPTDVSWRRADLLRTPQTAIGEVSTVYYIGS